MTGSVSNVQAPTDFRQGLRRVLQGRLREQERRRRRRRTRVLQVAVVGLMLAVSTGVVTDLGSVDFRLLQDGVTRLGQRAYRTAFGGNKYAGTDVMTERVLEQIHQREEAGEETLKFVEGWDIGSGAFFMTDYEYVVDGEKHTSTRQATSPGRKLTRDQLDFLLNVAIEGKKQIKAGRGRFSGYMSQYIDGKLVHLERWRVSIPGHGVVVYFRSYPPTW